jgi:hypothetical protein
LNKKKKEKKEEEQKKKKRKEEDEEEEEKKKEEEEEKKKKKKKQGTEKQCLPKRVSSCHKPQLVLSVSRSCTQKCKCEYISLLRFSSSCLGRLKYKA